MNRESRRFSGWECQYCEEHIAAIHDGGDFDEPCEAI